MDSLLWGVADALSVDGSPSGVGAEVGGSAAAEVAHVARTMAGADARRTIGSDPIMWATYVRLCGSVHRSFDPWALNAAVAVGN
jgi:hypothetical protein